jgi:hypothetical protein
MSGSKDDPFDLQNLRMPAEDAERLGAVPRKIQKRRRQFAILPMTWWEKLEGASGQTCRVAWYLLYENWKNKGKPIKLANEMLERSGISHDAKSKALRELARRGLIAMDGRRCKSPMVTVLP